MSSVTGSSVRSGNDPIHESETSRLQREVDFYTQKFENEKRQLQILQDQIKQVDNELVEKKENISKIRPKAQPELFRLPTQQTISRRQDVENKLEEIKLDHQAHAIKNEQLSLNQTKSKNKEYKREIDMLRKEIMYKNGEAKRLENLTRKMHKKAENENSSALYSKSLAEQQINQAIALRAKHEEDKDHFEMEIKRYQEKLYEKEEENKIDDDTSTAPTKDAGGKSGEFQNPLAILKLRLAKIVATNREKKRLMDQYLRNVKVIEDAFEQIKEATGITAIDEIVTSFIKAEEQNYSLLNYVNKLTNETDQLEDSNREIREQIDKMIELKNYSQEQKDNLKQQMEDELNFYETEIEKANNKMAQTKKMFAKVQEPVETMVSGFVTTKFFLSVATKMNYGDGIVFTENNIVSYLAELEEYVSSLITYMAFKRDDQHAATSAIPLEQLNEKKFDKEDLKIDPPDSKEFNKREDAMLEQANFEGNLPGETDDFFTEQKIKQYFQQVIERDMVENQMKGGANAGLSEGNTVLARQQDQDQEDYAPEGF